MPEKLVVIEDGSQIQSGIVKSLHKLQVPCWIDGQNVVFEDGAVRKSPGYVKYFALTGTDPITGMLAIDIATIPNLVFGDRGNLYRWNGSALTTDGTGYSGILNRDCCQATAVQGTLYDHPAWQQSVALVLGIWGMESFGTWSFATNGAEHIQINKMAGVGFVDLTGSPPTTAEFLVRFANQLLAFNLTGTNPDGTVYDSSFFAFSDIDNPEDWVGGAAGYLPIRDMGTPLVAGCRLGSYVAVYSQDAMALVSSLGSPLYFGAEKIFEGIGAAGKHAVVPVGFYNYGMSKKGVWKTDGTQYNYLSPPFLRKWLEDNVNFSGFGNQIAATLNEDRSLVEWGVPSKAGDGSNDVTVGLNIDTGAWTFKNFGVTSGAPKGIFDFPAFGLSNGKVFFGNIGVDADTDPIDAWVQSKPFPCETPASPLQIRGQISWGIVEMLRLAIRDLKGTVNVYFGWQQDLDDPITWSAAYPINMQSQPIFPLEEVQGKYFSIKLQSNTIGADWTFAGMELFGSFNGVEF